MENTNPTPQPWGYQPVPVEPAPPYPIGKKELIFGICAIFSGLILCNFTLLGGFNLGFAIAAAACICCSVGYLYAAGCRPDGYSTALLSLGLVITLGFARSDDGFVKFVMLCFLLVAVNMGLCRMAGQNRRSAAGFSSLLDVPRAMFVMGFDLPPTFRGLGRTLRSGGPMVKKSGAVLLGLVVAVPVLVILIPLLISADAAFEGLFQCLPEFNLDEGIATVIYGSGIACLIYTQGISLRHREKGDAPSPVMKRFISHLTVNTVLGAVCVVYVVYLISQLAYFVGGFSGILPEEFTMAEYARRGFFEMAWICAIDLGLMALAVGLVQKNQGKAPLSTRILCLFIGVVTVFLVATASAKMFLYIGSYGLTRLRLLTEVIMVYLAIATVMVSVWLFRPKLRYMQVLLITALIIGAAVLWVDVDTVVASYNVSAYQAGRLASIDLGYLEELGNEAIPQIAKLTEDSDPAVAARAKYIVSHCRADWNDFRGWNYVNWITEKLTGGRGTN